MFSLKVAVLWVLSAFWLPSFPPLNEILWLFCTKIYVSEPGTRLGSLCTCGSPPHLISSRCLLLLLLNCAAINNLKIGLPLWIAMGCKTIAPFSLQCWLLHPFTILLLKDAFSKSGLYQSFFASLSGHLKDVVKIIVILSPLCCYDKVTKSSLYRCIGWLVGSGMWKQCVDFAEWRPECSQKWTLSLTFLVCNMLAGVWFPSVCTGLLPGPHNKKQMCLCDAVVEAGN